jgi:hypothetical protein
MIHLQFFITYLKVSWVKQFFCNLNGDWQNILLLLTNLKDYGGVRTFSFQKGKLIEVSSKISNPFWKDIFNSLHLAKPYTLINMNECLSLDILNFVPIENAPFISNGKMLVCRTYLILLTIKEKIFILLNRLDKKLKLKISCSTTHSYQVFQSI